ncbi:MAG TPA: hypothetical protein VGN07_13780 [Steroidobacteraceae bacterium]|jgi:hypothetical protein
MRHHARFSTLLASVVALVTAFVVAYPQLVVAQEYELQGQLDLRSVAVDSPLTSFARGGMGLLRFDEEHDGLQLGRLLLDFSGPVTETVRAQVTASATADGDQNPIDFTEAFLEWRPYPDSQWRWRSRIGAFYPPISLENRAIGWQSLYSLSPSAINTWIGEEMRAMGVEVAATDTGASSGRAFDLTFIGGVYGWNDPMGVLIFQRGWAINDRQTTLFGALPRPLARAGERDIEFFHEIDDRPGYYAGAEMKWQQGHTLRYMHYDNRGDPSRSNDRDDSWLTRFDSIGARLELSEHWTLIAQGLYGDTGVGNSSDGRGALIADYWSYFTLGSYRTGPHRLSLRYDRMSVESVRGARFFDSRQNAKAWTAAWMFDWNDHWQAAVEALRIDGTVGERARAGLSPAAVEEQLQVALRYSF